MLRRTDEARGIERMEERLLSTYFAVGFLEKKKTVGRENYIPP